MTVEDYDDLTPIHRALFDGARSVVFKSFSIHTGEFSMNCEFNRETKLMEGCFKTLEDVFLTTNQGWNIVFHMELPMKEVGVAPIQYDLGVSLVRDQKHLACAIVTLSLISQEKCVTQAVSFFPEGDDAPAIFTREDGNLVETPATNEEVAETILSFIVTNVPTELCTMMPL